MFGLDLEPATLVSRLLTLVIALTVHEFAHAWSADRLGDTTPRSYGRLTLNPLAHLDVIGSLMMIAVGFGWAKPVPVNPYVLQRRSPSALMWVSLAGPGSNFLMALLAAIPIRLGVVPIYQTASGALLPTLWDFLVTFIFINLVLMLFNLIPLAPLDGDKIADYFYPPFMRRILEVIRPYGAIILLLLLFVVPRVTGFDPVNALIGQPLMLLMGWLLW